MYEVRLKNANVFNVPYSGEFSLRSMSYTGYLNHQVSLSSFSRDVFSYGLFNKYLKNDRMFNTLSYYFPSRNFTFLKLNQDKTSYKKSDFISYVRVHGNQIVPSITGVLNDLGYQYVYGNTNFAIPSLTGTVLSKFEGWLFPFQKLYVTVDPDFSSGTGSIGQTFRPTTVSYMMTQQSYYVKVQDHQANRSNKSVTRVSDNVQQFIQGKPTFISSVGLYDDESNLLAVGKFSRPVQKLNFAPMSFKLRFFN